jgi:nucleotide-binding universal stress UspA family protein
MEVLLGISDDEPSRRALRRTVDRAREAGDDLTVAVVDRPGVDRDPDEVFAAVRRRVEDPGLDAEVRRVEGDAGARLVEIAECEGFDRLVIGGGAESPMGKIELDELEQSVLLNSRISVTIVR